MQDFTKIVIQMIQSIPKRNVATYGQIARLAGNPRAARQVARILHTVSNKYDLPWHRVVNAKGEIVIGDSETAFLQKCLLEEEGIELINHTRVDLNKYKWVSENLDNDWIEG